MDHHQILRPDASSNPSGKSACDREQLHNLLHLLSAAGLLWFALQSWHATHPLGLIHALTARRSDAPSLARAAQPAPERFRRTRNSRPQMHHVNPPQGRLKQASQPHSLQPQYWKLQRSQARRSRVWSCFITLPP